jgi:energy-coupling factor transport system ATP-binding protein
LIKFTDFTFHYGDASDPALRRINLQIGDGEFVLISGPSGGGKSSLCRCINGLIPHFHGGKVFGSVEVAGLDVLQSSPRELATKVGMTFQDPENQLSAMDVEREIVFGMENLGFHRDLMSKRLEESLDTIGIASLRHRVIHELSGGEKQKVAIASVLSLHPTILVLDEPTSELDPKGAEDVLSMVQRLNDELGLTVILVEHRLERVAHLVDRLILVSGGEIVSDGDPREVLSDATPEEIGVGVPPMVRLASELRRKGIEVERTPLTVKEGRPMLERCFEQGCREVSHDGQRTPGNPMIGIQKLWFAYSGGNTALRDINLTFHQGECVAIMGRNASGKSTLVKHFNGLLKPTKGDVTVDAVNTRHVTVAELARGVGFVFQNPNDHLFAQTVEEEIELMLRNLGWSSRDIRTRTNEMFEMFHLKRYRRRYPRYLSGGEKQRVALASVIAARPKVLVLDEPTRGMDHRLKQELMQFLSQYTGAGNTVIMVTHDVETVAEHVDRVILLSEGEVVVDGDRRSVLSQALLFSPQINRLMQAFEKYGAPPDILTVGEAMDLLT